MNFDQAQIQLPTLNLPSIQPILQENEGRILIFDSLRKKYLVLTPEEWVRQHWNSFLLKELGFSRGLISLEKGLKYNGLQKRTDILVWNKEMKPYLLIECKSPKIKITQKTLEQVCLYQKELMTKFLILSNGIHHMSLAWNEEKQLFESIKNFPIPPR